MKVTLISESYSKDVEPRRTVFPYVDQVEFQQKEATVSTSDIDGLTLLVSHDNFSLIVLEPDDEDE